MNVIKCGWVIGGSWMIASLVGSCDTTRFIGQKTQVDAFVQTGDEVVEIFNQSGVGHVDAFKQTGFHQVDAFQQKAAAQVDVLWVIDNSATMTAKQDNLAANFDDFMKVLNNSQIGYHIGVVTTEMVRASHRGHLQGTPKIISCRTGDASDSCTSGDPVAQFAANVHVEESLAGGNEEGLMAAYLALSDPVDNAGFLRNNASLAVIFVSDENDHSVGPPSFYARFYTSLKTVGNEKNVILGAIAAPDEQTQKQCVENVNCCTGTADFGERYYQLVESMGGTKGNICETDFSTTLEQLGLTVAGLSHKFLLSKDPDWNTVVVRVDENHDGTFEKVVAKDDNTGWKPGMNESAIYFDGSYVPPPEADIQVEYGNVERRFLLSYTGDPTTLVVKVDGQEKTVNVDWKYDSASNAVVFVEGHVPAQDSDIEVSYSDLATTFTLTREVKNTETMQVWVGQEGQWQLVYKDDSTGWGYDPRDNTILFNGTYVPPLGTKVKVAYSNLIWLFPLSIPPDVGTIVVTLDRDGEGPGTPATVPAQAGTVPGWIYYSPDANPPYTNCISFEKFEQTEWPPINSVVTVTYIPGSGQ